MITEPHCLPPGGQLTCGCFFLQGPERNPVGIRISRSLTAGWSACSTGDQLPRLWEKDSRELPRDGLLPSHLWSTILTLTCAAETPAALPAWSPLQMAAAFQS